MHISRRNLLSLLALLPAIPGAALACECVADPGLEAETAQATTIVFAKLVTGGRLLLDGAGRVASFEPAEWRILQSWKGELRPGETFVTHSTQSNCGVTFSESDAWVLFLIGRPPFEVSSCSRIVPAKEARQVMSFLNSQLGWPK